MIERFSKYIAQKMISNEIISQDDYEMYSYNIEVTIDSIISHSVLLAFAALFGCFIKIVIFMISFDCLRQYSSGFHCHTNIGCNLLSMFVCTFMMVAESFCLSHWTKYQGGVDIINDICYLYQFDKSSQYELENR